MLKYIISWFLGLLVGYDGYYAYNTSAPFFISALIVITSIFVLCLLLLFVRKIKSLAFFGG